MAYRRPSNPRHDALERWQTLAAQVAGLSLAVVLAGLGFLYADRRVPPQHLPWKPLSLDRPFGLATGAQQAAASADLAACRRALDEGGVAVQPIPDRTEGEFCVLKDALFVGSGATRLSPAGAVMTCPQALAYVLWDRQVVRPAAQEVFGAEVARIEHYGTYACRRRYGLKDAQVSEHATANALDVGAFVLADGRRIAVRSGWAGEGDEAVFLRRVRDGACRLFGAVLGPDYNAAHADHLHLDKGGAGVCS